ncbi:MAG: SOS response-associated peptidase [Cyclobacteriaceae bacterium]|nr:SOS response-associated peptidase [Cyclobacteriaceae bacterium]MCH8516610.1 SOS response-associated peptidase [Cyclobacteriaceae bacterium]
MCGRYSIAISKEKIQEKYKIDISPTYKPIYNAAPSMLLPIITSDAKGGLSFFYWGFLPQFSKNKSISHKLINTRSETISEKKSFSAAFKERRCIIPAHGFFEWKQSGKKSKIPYFIKHKSLDIISFAGIWEEFEDENNETKHCFTIITTSAPSSIESIHNRMPVILDDETEKVWMDSYSNEDQLKEVLQEANQLPLSFYTVSSEVNKVSNNFSDLHLPSAPMDQHGNYTLFN